MWAVDQARMLRGLAGLGYQAHLIDATEKHVNQALRSVAPLASTQVGDARSLPFADGSAAAILLLGPLYHLTAREERIAALREAGRALSPGGSLFAAAISHFASLLDALARGFIDDPAFQQIVDRDLREGQHRNSTGRPEYRAKLLEMIRRVESEPSLLGMSSHLLAIAAK
jgi:SAM-dependent methyltransferase